MTRRNGFMTVYVLCLGAITLAITIASTIACRSYLESARNYAAAIRLTYAAESMLYVVWDEFTALPVENITSTKRWYTTDPYGVIQAGDTVELYWVATVWQYPYTGTLWAVVYDSRTYVQRTSSLRFHIELGEDGVTPRYTVVKQQY